METVPSQQSQNSQTLSCGAVTGTQQTPMEDSVVRVKFALRRTAGQSTRTTATATMTKDKIYTEGQSGNRQQGKQN